MASLRFDFSGETVLVTGACRGIGQAVARGFAAAGAEVYMLATGSGLEAAAATIAAETGATCHPLSCDITDAAAVRGALASIERLDVLVNNAGLERITPLTDPDPEVEETFRRIILTASIWSRTAVPEFSAYVASKHANLGFMRAAAHELGPKGITVNAVCPGWVKTEAAMLSLSNMARRSGRPEQQLLDEIVGAQGLGGLLEPADMVPLYLYLASDGAKDITGQAYMLDRGEVMA